MKNDDRSLTDAKIQAISRFAGRVVHDVNNFSTIIINVAELLKDDLENNPEAMAKVKMLADVGERMVAYTTEINQFRLREPQKLSSSCEVNKIIDETIKNINDEKINFLSQNDEYLAGINVDDFRYIIVELIKNAQEANNEIQKPISIETFFKDEEVNIVLRDNGCGVSEQISDALFEPFISAKKNVKGVGLSLSKIYSLVHNAGGSISINSLDNIGTTIKLSLPGELAPSAAKNSGKKQVLVVDDQDLLRELAVNILKQQGFEVFSAQSAEEAAKLSEKHPNLSLLLTDLVLPNMDGKGLTALLRKKCPKLKVIMMSGYPQSQSSAGDDLKDVSFVNKPFTKNQLIEAVEKINV